MELERPTSTSTDKVRILPCLCIQPQELTRTRKAGEDFELDLHLPNIDFGTYVRHIGYFSTPIG